MIPEYVIGPEARKYFKKGYFHQMRGELDKAVFHYRKSLEVQPTAEGYTFLGWAYSFMGRFEDAITECRKAIELDPDFGNPYNDIGSYLLQMGRLDEAAQWLEKAKRARRYANPEYPYCNMGKLYEMRGMIDQAMDEYREALRCNPDYEPARTVLKRLEAMKN